MKKKLNALSQLVIGINSVKKKGVNMALPFLQRIKLIILIPLLLLVLHTKAQEGIANPTPSLRTAPAGSLVIAMDNILQAKGNGDFNLKTYGLVVRLLNANKKLRWVIRAGKVKDAIDFTANADIVYPTAQASASRNFVAGPFVIYPQDTTGCGAIITAFNNTLAAADRIKVYRLTNSTTVDVRYDLFNPVMVGILDEGGAYGVHEGYMQDASIPTTNYEATDRYTVNSKCYTFVSEPHNGSTGPWIDSVKKYVLRGGNFLAECAAIISYEEHASTGGFQTNGGFDNVNEDINAEVVFPQPDLSYIQVNGLVKPKQGGNTQTYSLNPGATTKNDFSAITKGSTNHPDVYGASVSDLLLNQLGGLVFYLGNHEYKDDNEEGINGIRMFFNAMLTPSSHLLCPSNVESSTNPDFNSTYVNVPVPGNVSTNDRVPAGTTYGTTPTLLSSPAGSTPSITMNSNGTYSFVSNLPGVYTYDVPVCIPGQLAPCPPTKLVITVLNAYINSNFPVANVDIATTKLNTPVTLKTLANDAAGNSTTALVTSSVTVTIAPLYGTTSVNAATGDITFTPTAGYTGTDTLTYQVCDNQTPAKCATAKQIITIIPSGLDNRTVAADDYRITNINTAATGNVKTNDSDPEGHTQTVTTQNTTIAGKGTLVLAADGSYTFTPVTGYTGPVDFPYTTCDNGTPQACAMATLHVLVRPYPAYTNPDFNSTFVNIPVPGNVNTNDFVPAGTTYGTTPTLLSSPVGSSPSITMNPNGTYSFVSNLPGVYTYDVPVCVPAQVAPCPPTKLVITVLNANITSNFPVANVDIATTNINTPVTLRTLANDAAGNSTTALVTSSVTVTVAPLYGTTSVNALTGDITFTPTAGYTGTDTLTYQVCDNQAPPKCATARQIITIRPAGSPNTTVAADDYRITNINIAATGNVKTNDSDPEGNTQTVTAQNTTVAGKGTLVLAADGSYTFTPVTGYTGPVDFPYTTCDNGVPQACAMATLHILVRPVPPSTNPDFNSTFVNVPVPGNVNTNDRVPAGTIYGTTPTLLSGPAGSTPSIVMNPNGTYSFVSNVKGVYIYNVPVCVPGQAAPCPPTKLTITVLDGPTNTNSPVANVDIAITKINTPVTLKSLANDAAGNTTSFLDPSSVIVTVAPLHGTTSVNPATGDITYTPAAGYTGTDTLTYQVCDDQVPVKCATANQIITIIPVVYPNTTEAADDYNITLFNTPATGNVKTNDTDAEGNTQTVTAQNITLAGKGNLVLGTNGNYTFTPFAGFSGPVDYPYTTCDNGVPVACATATLHILVRPNVFIPDLTPNITTIPNIILDTMNFNVTVRIQELDNAATNGSEILVRIIKDSRITFTYNPALTTVGFTAVQNNVWAYDGSDFFFHIFRTTIVIPANGASTFGFVANFNPGGKSRGKYTMTASLNSLSGGEVKTNNNQDAEVLDYLFR